MSDRGRGMGRGQGSSNRGGPSNRGGSSSRGAVTKGYGQNSGNRGANRGGNRGRGRGGAAAGPPRPKIIRDDFKVIKTKPSNIVSKVGTSGTPVNLITNYFKVNEKPDFDLIAYRVDFAPDISSTALKKKIMQCYSKDFGTHVFDGSQLFLARRLKQDPMEIFHMGKDSRKILIKIRHTNVVDKSDGQFCQILNLFLRTALEVLKLQLVGRHYFDPNTKITVNELRLDVWPGFVTSIRQHEEDLLMCVDSISKIMRNETVYEIMCNHYKQNPSYYQENFTKEVLGTVVLTGYNNKTYKISDIDWKQNPNSTFETPAGPISYKDYYLKVSFTKIFTFNSTFLCFRKCGLCK